MLAIPLYLAKKYETQLVQNDIPVNLRAYYFKWLRYYLDFCDKNHLEPNEKNNFSAFDKKLHSKNQSVPQRQQAKRAIAIFYRGIGDHSIAGNGTKTDSISKAKKQNNYADLYETGKKLSNPLSGKEPTEISLIQHTENTQKVVKNIPVLASQSVEGERHPNGTPETNLPKLTGTDWVWVYEGLATAIKVRHYSPKTLKAYKVWTQKFQAFTKSKDPRLLTMDDVKGFLSFLAVERKIAASSQNQAFNALLFLFRHVLEIEFGKVEGVVRAKRRTYIPVVLSRDEVNRVISHLEYPYNLIAKLLYGCGLRLFECLKLRIQDLNFDMKILTIHDGKGQKDRTLPMPSILLSELEAQRANVIELHQEDLAAGFTGTFLPGALAEKYKNASKELVWQWLFPAKTLTLIPDTQEYKRYHLHESHVQKAIKRAVQKSQIPKRATAHTFRHSFASHLLQANYDIRTIQEMLGHSDLKTTMIYTHTVQSVTIKQAKSPLDFDEQSNEVGKN